MIDTGRSETSWLARHRTTVWWSASQQALRCCCTERAHHSIHNIKDLDISTVPNSLASTSESFNKDNGINTLAQRPSQQKKLKSIHLPVALHQTTNQSGTKTRVISTMHFTLPILAATATLFASTALSLPQYPVPYAPLPSEDKPKKPTTNEVITNALFDALSPRDALPDPRSPLPPAFDHPEHKPTTNRVVTDAIVDAFVPRDADPPSIMPGFPLPHIKPPKPTTDEVLTDVLVDAVLDVQD